MSFEVIIVGSGPAGVSAALELSDKNVLILDVGFSAPQHTFDLEQNLYDLKKHAADLSPAILGEQFESLHNLFSFYLSPKLKSPLMRFVTKDWQQLCPLNATEFEGVLSFAEGGLSNAWGGGVYRFTDSDLVDFPIKAADLHPFYDRLTAEIGVCGSDDDLTSFFGSTTGLLPPVDLDRMSSELLRRYAKKKQFFSRRGIYIGKPRLAVLTKAVGERQAYDYYGLEFFKPNISGIYNSAYTLKELKKRPNITYRSGFLVQKYIETPDGVRVLARNLTTGAVEEFYARKLVLGAGMINTSKIVLVSNDDYSTHLSLLDNAVSFTPFVAPRLIGAAIEKRFFAGVQLNVIFCRDKSAAPIQGSFYGINGILRSDLLIDLPLSIKGNRIAAKYLTPALGVLQLFYPDSPSPNSYLKINSKGEVVIKCQRQELDPLEGHFISAFRRLGFYSWPSLIKYPAPGNSFHYAGSLPMKSQPQSRYETSANGLLFNSRHVYVVDSSNFPALPSKNHTFTIMANSMRIAHSLKRELES